MQNSYLESFNKIQVILLPYFIAIKVVALMSKCNQYYPSKGFISYCLRKPIIILNQTQIGIGETWVYALVAYELVTTSVFLDCFYGVNYRLEVFSLCIKPKVHG